jgi:hypothetical protein
VPLRFSLDCPFLCAPTVFSGLSVLLCPCGFLWVVLSCVPLRFSLDCPSSCVPAVFSGLSFLVCPYGFLWIVHRRKPKGHTRKDNQEKTVGAHKGGQSKGLFTLVYPCSFLWVVLSYVPLWFSLDCPPLCALTVFSRLSATTQRKP